MRVVAKNKEAIDRFERIMRYKDDEFFCYRVFQFERCNEYIASQLSLGDRRSTPPVYPRFDRDNAFKVKLDFDDLTKVLQVLRGETESINDGKGLFHICTDKYQTIRLRHMIAVCGYSLEVYETSDNDGEHVNESTARIFLSTAEALGLSPAIEHSFAAIAFGIPVI